MPDVTIYTDGSWKNRIQAGGWACLMVSGPYWQVISGGEQFTTISRMELPAVVNALSCLIVPCEVTVVSDSMYTVKSINEWIYNWNKNGWKTSQGKPVENQDLLRVIMQYIVTRHKVKAKWIKSHTRRTGVHYLGNGCVDWFAQYNADVFK